jgi:WhiB family transcriptional regulator, redox-sensing transcriptional regulator
MATQGSPARISTEDDGALKWMDLASCKDTDTDVFFPLGTPGMTEYDAAVMVAKRICAWCPVKTECLDYAMNTEGRSTGNDDMGIYGGLTHAERKSHYRRTREAARRNRG